MEFSGLWGGGNGYRAFEQEIEVAKTKDLKRGTKWLRFEHANLSKVEIMTNDHISNFLDYYLQTVDSPGYAIMIAGPWEA
jgi:hypothetical protein